MTKKETKKINDVQTTEYPKAPLDTVVDKTIRRHVYIAMGIGLTPFPFVDFVGVTAVQLNLIRKLAKVYKVPFAKDMVKNLIVALIGGAFPVSAGWRLAVSASKIIPGVGHAAGIISTPVVAGACTYAVGKVFNRHFAEGGTFLSFNAHEARAFYQEMFQKGQDMAAAIKSSAKPNHKNEA